jgi:hypothetical protein
MQAFEELLTKYCNTGLWKAARELGADMSEYYGNNDSPPVFGEDSQTQHIENVSAAGEDGFDPSKQHDDKQKSGSHVTEWREFAYPIMKRMIENILQYDPKDHRSILEVAPGGGPVDLVFNFLYKAAFISPSKNPYWKNDGFSEKQKRAFVRK